jgi:PAS domain S-box-containing protein
MTTPEAGQLGLAGDASRAHAVLLLESVADAAFAFDREWRYTYVNAAAERFLKIERAKLIGRVCWDLFPQRPDDDNARGVLQTMAERTPFVWESQSSISGRWCHWRSYPMPDGGVAVIVQSIDERVRAEQKLRASERQ